MDKNMDYNNFYGYNSYEGFENMDNGMFNPIAQYEQAYMYYRYLTQQLEYKIKCKEYEKLCSSSNSSKENRTERRLD